eukprot:RCo047332
MAESTSNFKVCLLGEGRVGKTSLVRRYINDEFLDKEQTTVQASMYSKKRVSVGDQVVTIAIWDTAGQERFHALGPIYYRDADGALLVYDITDQDTFDRVKHWVRELKAVVGEDIVLCVAGNKSDLERSRQVTLEEALAYCRSVGASHFTVSAKLNKNVGDIFVELARRMVKVRAAKAAAKRLSGGGNSSASSTRRNTFRVLDDPDNPPAPPSSNCCR